MDCESLLHSTDYNITGKGDMALKVRQGQGDHGRLTQQYEEKQVLQQALVDLQSG